MACQLLFNNSGDDGTNSNGTQTMQIPKDNTTAICYVYIKMVSMNS